MLRRRSRRCRKNQLAPRTRRPFVSLGVEALECRQLMAAEILASLDVTDHVLRIEGTAGADQIRVLQTNVSVSVEGVSITVRDGTESYTVDTLDVANVQRVEVHALAGDDLVEIVEDDVLPEDAISVKLVGSAGHDTLLGGSGRDELYGGLGDDQLQGNGGQDILEAGYDAGSFGTTAAQLDADLGLYTTNNLWENNLGRHEKWVMGREAQWYYILPSGEVYKFLTGERMAALDATYHADVFKLVNAYELFGVTALDPLGPTAAQADRDFHLSAADILSENWGGVGEKWVVGAGGSYFILPNGELHSWDLTPLQATGPLLVTLDSSYHQDISKLIDAEYLFGGMTDHDSVTGGDDADVLRGGPGNDTLDGGEGADRIHAGPGLNRVFGGAGADLLAGGAGADFLDGGPGDDRLDGSGGRDSLYGGLGDDTLRGDEDKDYLDGQDGNDDLRGGDQNDTVFGGTGDDIVWGGAHRDYVHGGSGNDVLYGDNNYTMIAFWELWGDGSDPHAHDTVLGAEGNDQLVGGNGNDYLSGGDGVDVIHGEKGNDTIYGGNGADTLHGDAGHDLIHGDNNRLTGDSGADIVHGGSGNDTLYGGASRDTVYGGVGADRLYSETSLASYPRVESIGTDVLSWRSGDTDFLVGGATASVSALSSARGWAPIAGRLGEVITVTGQGFTSDLRVRFGSDPAAPSVAPLSVSADGSRLTVRIPRGALSGRLVLLQPQKNALGVTTGWRSVASSPYDFSVLTYRSQHGFGFGNGPFTPSVALVMEAFGNDQTAIRAPEPGFFDDLIGGVLDVLGDVFGSGVQDTLSDALDVVTTLANPWNMTIPPGLLNKILNEVPVIKDTLGMIPKPETLAFAVASNVVLDARCFGMALTSSRFAAANESTADLFQDYSLMRTIEKNQLHQFSREVIDHSLTWVAQAHAGEHSAQNVRSYIRNLLNENQFPIININDVIGRGHSVVAYDISTASDTPMVGDYYVHIYNPNVPWRATGDESRVYADRNAAELLNRILIQPDNRWFYNHGTLAQPDWWEGGFGNLIVLPPSVIPAQPTFPGLLSASTLESLVIATARKRRPELALPRMRYPPSGRSAPGAADLSRRAPPPGRNRLTRSSTRSPRALRRKLRAWRGHYRPNQARRRRPVLQSLRPRLPHGPSRT